MMIPGSASAQRTPLGPSSEERPSVSSRTKPFVAPYVANYDEALRTHTVPPASAARDVSFYFQGGANNRGIRVH